MFKERKTRRGFTLAEVLIVVAIVAILLAVAIPNVIGYYRSLKLTELDDSARTIFVAAQNRLTAMRNMGADLSALGSDTKSATLTTGGTATVSTVTDPDMLASLVPGGSVDSKIHDNNYVVEIDPKTGAVIAVWYWEKESFDYAAQAYGAVKPEKKDRLEKAQMVGYYGGTKVDRLEFGQMPFPAVDLINAEELRVEITVPDTTSVSAGSTKLLDDNIFVDVTIEGSGGSKHSVFGTDGAKLYSGRTGTVVLDSLKRNNRPDTATDPGGWTVGNEVGPFQNWSGVTAGDSGEISVKVTLRDKDNIFLPQTVTVHTNAWFADAHENAGAAGTYSADIAYGRHLQNLDTDKSGVTSTITGAVQVRDIDFDDATTVTGVYSWQDTYGDEPFKPITNNNLTSYDGGKKEIRNLNVNRYPSGDAGLFSTTAAELSQIRLVNASVTGGDNVGALAGQYDGSAITDCGAYVDDAGKPAGVTGHAYDHYTVTGNSAGENVGGLIGIINSEATLTGSFAAVKVSGGDNVGGLVGLVNGSSTFKNCYSGGHTESGHYGADANVTGADGVGGLVGLTNVTLTLEGVNYSTCSVKTTGSTLTSVGLLVGNISSTGNVTMSTAAVTNKAYATGEAFDDVGTKVTSGFHDESAYLDNDFGTNSMTTGFATHKYDTTLSGDYPYDTNLGEHYGDWIEDSPAAQSFGYYDNGGGSFGFWGYIVDAANPGTPAFANSLNRGTPGGGGWATIDGYCVPVEQVGGKSTAPAAPTVDGVSGISINGTPVGTYTDSATSKTYDLYEVTGLENVSATNYYNKITVGSTEYYFNPFFACEIQTTTPANMKTPQAKQGTNRLDPRSVETDNYNGKVIIRTARQLANMSAQTGGSSSIPAAKSRSYVQLLNIDFNTYAQTDLAGKEAHASEWNPMELTNSGAYNGNEFVISNLFIDKTSVDNVGLFGNTKGKLTQIRLVNIQVTGENYVGALAGRVVGDTTEIENCGVYVYAVTDYDTNYGKYIVKGGNNVGGLLGNANSEVKKIKDCFAAVKVQGVDRVGGLIGNLTAKDHDATIENCYSGGHTSGGTYTNDANVTGESRVGGLIGYVSGSTTTPREPHTVTISGINYSTCSVKSGKEIGLLIGDVDTDGEASIVVDTAVPSTAYAISATYNSTGTATAPRAESYLTPYAANLADILAVTNGGTAASASKYDDTLGASYPYLSAGAEHHGDWPELQEAVFYWEREGTETNFYAKGYLNNQEVTLDTLCTEHHDVNASMNANATSNEEWGYGLYGRTSGTVPEKPRDSSGNEITEKTGTTIEDIFTKLLCLDSTSVGASTGASVTMLSGGTADKACSTASKVDTLQTYNLNLGFGAAIQVGASSTMGNKDGIPYQIRNVRQLDNISDSSSSSFQQTHDMYGVGYSSGYGGASSFVGTYKGQSYRILELNMTNGLFTSINGSASLDSIILYSPSGNATVTGSGAPAGGLAGSVTGSGDTYIKNCVVAGYTMTNNGNPLGGLVGKVERATTYDEFTITNSEAVNTLSCGTNNNGDNAGGLVGQATICTVYITNSYAGGEITSGRQVGGIVGFVDTTGFTAGLVGYTNVYSYMKINGIIRYAIGPCGSSSVTAYYHDCYYWGDGFTNPPTDRLYVTDKDSDGLKTCISGTGIGTVSDEEHTFIPSNVTGLTGPYPYPAVVKDHDGDYVHYGDWE